MKIIVKTLENTISCSIIDNDSNKSKLMNTVSNEFSSYKLFLYFILVIMKY